MIRNGMLIIMLVGLTLAPFSSAIPSPAALEQVENTVKDEAQSLIYEGVELIDEGEELVGDGYDPLGGSGQPTCSPYYIGGKPKVNTHPLLGMIYIDKNCIRDGIDRWTTGGGSTTQEDD